MWCRSGRSFGSLGEWVERKAPAALVFGIPDRSRMRRAFRADLAAAGIAPRDAEKRAVDFHALRHTFISSLAAAGVHPETAQTLARHSTYSADDGQVYAHVAGSGSGGAGDPSPTPPPLRPRPSGRGRIIGRPTPPPRPRGRNHWQAVKWQGHPVRGCGRRGKSGRWGMARTGRMGVL